MPVNINSSKLKYKDPTTGEYTAVNAVGGEVQDVQVNGVSVLENGVANVPIGSVNNFGVFKRGSGLYDTNGVIGVNSSSDANVKSGTVGTFTTVSRQHLATFYGLAKAAGADMALSDNPIGTYTDEAKIAIQKMLGIYEAPWELIREDTFTNAEEAEHEITVDGNGESFILSDVLFMFEQRKQEDASSFNGSIFFHYAYLTGTYNTPIKIECGSWTQAANASAHGTYVILKQEGKLLELYRTAQTTSSNTGALGARYTDGLSSPGNTDRVGIYVVDTPVYINKIRIGNTVGTGHYKLFGKRKWQ